MAYNVRKGVIAPVVGIFLLCFAFILLYTQVVQAKSNKPLIGILLNDGGNGGYSQFPWYAMRQNYSKVIAENGGIPVFIGHDIQPIDDYLELLDGIVLTGGDFYSPPNAYTTGIKDTPNYKKYPREHIEFALIKKGYEKDIPVIGICAGMQQMNLAMGGTIYENLKKSLNTPIQHRNEDRETLQHGIKIEENTVLYKMLKTKNMKVNSNHNAGINKLSSKFIISAKAPDGVIEGMEAQNKRFFIGVMWHPEFVLTKQEKILWKEFVQAASEYHKSKAR